MPKGQCSGHWLSFLTPHHIPTQTRRTVPLLTGGAILAGSSLHSTFLWLAEGIDVGKAGQSSALRCLKSEHDIILSLLGGTDKDVRNSHVPWATAEARQRSYRGQWRSVQLPSLCLSCSQRTAASVCSLNKLELFLFKYFLKNLHIYLLKCV